MKENNQSNKKQEHEVEKKRKSKFAKVIALLIVILAITFALLTTAQKENYTVLDNTSKEVAPRIKEIKDIRTIKGYKVLEGNGKNQLILISAGLTYDKDGTIKVENVEFNKDKVSITISENINENPEIEKVTYPFLIVKVDKSIKEISVSNVDGEVYNEIFINGEENIQTNPEEDKDKDKNEDEVKVEDEVKKEELETDKEDKEQDVENEEAKEDVEEKPATKALTCVFQGRVDSNSVEVSVGDTYRTFDVSKVQNSFTNMEIGKEITVEFEDTSMGQKIVSVK